MDISILVMWLGFILASYSVVGNDVIQTLGTFLTSNEKHVKWWILWLFAAVILTAALTNGYMQGDLSYGRLDKFQAGLAVMEYKWYFLLPPIVLLAITRYGIPVSTTFMILSLFSLNAIPNDLNSMLSSIFDTDSQLGGMIQKSFLGYVVAFSSALIIYLAITRLTEKRFLRAPISDRARPFWVAAQWASTGFLWYQWLSQDLANIYVYLRGGKAMSLPEFLLSLFILLALLAFIFYSRGGAVQKVVRKKTNTADIRAATYIDFIYAIILYIFKYDSFMGMEYQFPWTGNLPMSTTWVFIGLLAGREIGMQVNMYAKVKRKTSLIVFADLGKVFFGLMVSVVLVLIIKLLAA
jgi:hypothetical protein